MTEQRRVGVIGAGVIGCAIAWALAKEGWKVLLVDRAEPGIAGASYGNVGHIATELIEPLPSRALLLGFWRELFVLGGALDIPLRRLPALLPWARRFAAASGRRAKNTDDFAPLVAPALTATAGLLSEIGRPELLRKHGHYEVWLGRKAVQRADKQARAMARLGIPTLPADAQAIRAIEESLPESTRRRTRSSISALRFTGTGHVTDPWQLVLALAHAVRQRNGESLRAEVRKLTVIADGIEITTSAGVEKVDSAVIAAGAWSAPLLTSFGLSVPMEAVRGYHVDLTGHPPVIDAPVLYSDMHIVVTPMAGRLRASSYMDFVELEAAPDPRKSERLVARLGQLGYAGSHAASPWWGPRPILPDYLPGIGRVPGTPVFYAIGHHHLGLTLAAVTAELVADLVAERVPRHDVAPFDLRRFGVPSRYWR
jgi:D-hydroxyproline dehydrogenase